MRAHTRCSWLLPRSGGLQAKGMALPSTGGAEFGSQRRRSKSLPRLACRPADRGAPRPRRGPGPRSPCRGGQSTGPNAADAIGRANLNGTRVNQRFISGLDDPGSVAVNAAHVYWTTTVYDSATDRVATAIGRANLDGTGVDRASSPRGSPRGWRSAARTSTGPPRLVRGWYGGSGAPPRRHARGRELLSRTGRRRPCGQRRARLLDQQQDDRARQIDGTGKDRSFIRTGRHPICGSRSTPGTSTGRAGTTTVQQDTIGRANLDGTQVNERSSRSGHPSGVAVDGAHVYWAQPQHDRARQAERHGRATGASSPARATPRRRGRPG